MSPSKFLYWAVAYSVLVIVIGYTLFLTSQYDVIFTFANQCFGEVCWHNMHIQGHCSSGRAGGAVKELRAMETTKKQKNRYQIGLLLFINNVDRKNNNRNYRTHSEFSGCPKSCMNLFQVDLDKPGNYLWYCYEKTPPPPLPTFWNGRGGNDTMPPSSGVLVHIILHALSLLVVVGYTMCHCNEHKLAAVS